MCDAIILILYLHYSNFNVAMRLLLHKPWPWLFWDFWDMQVGLFGCSCACTLRSTKRLVPKMQNLQRPFMQDMSGYTSDQVEKFKNKGRGLKNRTVGIITFLSETFFNVFQQKFVNHRTHCKSCFQHLGLIS